MTQKVIFFTTPGTGSYTIPNDFGRLISVEAIGGGGNGGTVPGTADTAGGSGGGGAYAKTTTVTLTAGGTVYYQVGAAATDSWFSTQSSGGVGVAPTFPSQGCLAKAGTSASGQTSGSGGSSATSVGDTRFSGGNGSNGASTAAPPGGAGGGGAAGPAGAGGAGAGSANTTRGGGGGGGAGNNVGAGSAGTASSVANTGGAGGNGGSGTGGGAANTAGTAGTGGGAGGGNTAVGLAGGTGSYWTQTSDNATAGSGGGGSGGGVSSGGSPGGNGGNGALYGGGGGGTGSNPSGATVGAGAQGIVVFTYDTDPEVFKGSGYKFRILNLDGTASSTVVDFDDMFVEKELFLDAGLYGWGNSAFGQLGNSSTGINYSSPIQVGAQTNWRSVIPSGGSSVSAVKVDGSLWTWGGAGGGELGNGTTTAVSSPVQVGSLYNWKQTACDEDGSIWAIKTDGTLWAWGRNTSGQLGNGTITSYSSPIQIGALNNWKQVAGNGGNSNASNCALAVKTDGTLWAWGGNATGQLGNGNRTYYSSPIQIGSLSNWKYVAGNSSSQGASNNAAGVSYGIKTDGTLWAWGYSPFGIGNGSLSYYSSPIQIGALTNWKQISTSWGATLAIKTDGTLWSWGNNNFGQLGNSNRAYYSSPVQVGSLTNWKQVSSGGTCVAAIKTDGTLWVWGGNMYTQLGQGFATTSLYYSSPIQVGSLTSWKSVKASFYAIHAISSPDLP